MRVAVIGAGIAGNVAAYHLNREHDVTVFEAGRYVGGHTNTIDVNTPDGSIPIDTGFIVFNDRTYPHFIDLLEEIGVESKASDMSFSVRGDAQALEYNGSNLNGLFAQRRNLLRPSFHRMIRDILRFNREAPDYLDAGDVSTTLGEYLGANGYSREFTEHYLVPMGAAIWSAEPHMLERMPAQFFIRFFANHGLLSLDDRPQWRVIRGGSRAYVKKLVAGFWDRIRLDTPVLAITRLPDRVIVRSERYGAESFDAVFLACHSDQALAMLTDASRREREILGAIPYQRNSAVLHTDATLMPHRRRAWASWNYHLPKTPEDGVTLTYHMNRLQGFDADGDYFVTLNSDGLIRRDAVIRQIDYQHPVFTAEGVRAQQRKSEIDGSNRTYFCGAYWRYGFHEDGVVSALSALQRFAENQEHVQRYLQRAS
jgi:predicted NAD/FAD-binding protein